MVVNNEFGIGNDVKQMEYKFCKILSGVKNKKKEAEFRINKIKKKKNWAEWFMLEELLKKSL